jgi:Kelch motif
LSPNRDRRRRSEHRQSRRAASEHARRTRLLPLIAVLLALVVGLFVAFRSGGGSSSPEAPNGASSQEHRRYRPVARLARHGLPAPLSGESVLGLPGRVLVLGGLDTSDVSTSEALELSTATGKFSDLAPLSEPRHDTAAAAIGGKTMVFGGGSLTELDSVESFSPRGSPEVVGQLPTTRSDLSAVTVAGRAYVLGGYDGNLPLAPVLRTSDGRSFTSIGDLPVPFRYAAVATIGRMIYTFGGELANGLDSDAIQAIDTRGGRARVIGHLDRPLSHASAVVLGGRIYVLGGRSRENPTDEILSFDPSTEEIRLAGHLPFPVTNAAAGGVGAVGYLIGGLDAEGGSLASVIEVRLVGHRNKG